MSFDAKAHLLELLRAASAKVAPALDALDREPHLERPRQASLGDYACNLAMQLARSLKENPRAIAQKLIDALPGSPWILKTEIGGAGFINFHLAPAAKTGVVKAVLKAAQNYGRGKPSGQKIMVEFVSANPTGPLHVGHGRGAAYGASLAALLAYAGHEVSREFYVNDAGRQMDILALSTWLRCLELHGKQVPFPPNAYQGGYVRDMAQGISLTRHMYFWLRTSSLHALWLRLVGMLPAPPRRDNGEYSKEEKQQLEDHLDGLINAAKKLLREDWNYLHQHALTEQLADCREDLEGYGVHFEQWFSERSLFDTGMVHEAINELEARGHLYVQNGAKWFRATAFGDEKDRVVQRDNGAYTYLASDIAYHVNKFRRGFDRVIDVWGADHHGYIPRLKGALQALDIDPQRLAVNLVQFVSLYRDGVKVGMSTRAGEYVTLRELRNEVGNDACRFFYLLRKADQSLDFDLTLAKTQSSDNPVYYVQYAHARICSVLAQWGGDPAALHAASLAPLTHPHELALCARLAEFPELVAAAASDCSPHSLAFYLRELAADFHGWYNAERLLAEDAALKCARLALALATRQVLHNGLGILGVTAPESM